MGDSSVMKASVGLGGRGTAQGLSRRREPGSPGGPRTLLRAPPWAEANTLLLSAPLCSERHPHVWLGGTSGGFDGSWN